MCRLSVRYHIEDGFKPSSTNQCVLTILDGTGDVGPTSKAMRAAAIFDPSNVTADTVFDVDDLVTVFPVLAGVRLRLKAELVDYRAMAAGVDFSGMPHAESSRGRCSTSGGGSR